MIHLPDTTAFMQTWFAVLRLGAVAVFSNTEFTQRELTHCIDSSDATHVVTVDRWFEDIEMATADASRADRVSVYTVADLSLDSLPAQSADELPAVDLDGESPAEIIFTSGTTAAPKPVLLSHRNLLYFGEEVKFHTAMRPTDDVLAVLPGYHANAQFVSYLSTLLAGGTIILSEVFETDRFVDQLQRHEPTLTSIGAPHARALLAKPERPAEANNTLREVCFGLNMTEDERQEFERRFDTTLLKLYGTTEHGIFTFQPIHGDRNWHRMTLGRPTFGRDVRLIDEDENEVPPGSSGEIAVNGTTGIDVMVEYYGMPEKTSAAWTDSGLLKTGDVGRFDERGYLYFETRTKHIIETRGENVSQEEVESVLEGHEGVTEAAAIGIPHEVFGEVVLAVVRRADDDLSEKELAAYAEQHLASFKRPERIEFATSFPRTSVGKVDRNTLEERYRED